jgi:hypothetical protein
MPKLFVIFTEKLEALLYRALRWQSNLKVTGPGVTLTNTPDGATIVINPPRAQAARRSSADVTVLITEAYAGGGKYAGKILAPPTGTLAKTGTLSEADCGSTTDAVDCIVYYAREQGATTHVLLDDPATAARAVYNGRLIGAGDDDLPVVLIDGGRDGAFPVTCVKTGGVAGTGSNPGPGANCSWVYTAKLGSVAIGTGLTPQRPRLPNTAYAAGDGPGLAWFGADGLLVLAEAYKEFPNASECE